MRKKIDLLIATALGVAAGITAIGYGNSIAQTEHHMLGVDIMGAGGMTALASLVIGAVGGARWLFVRPKRGRLLRGAR